MSASNDKKESRTSKNGVISRSVRDEWLNKIEDMEKRLDALAKKLESTKRWLDALAKKLESDSK